MKIVIAILIILLVFVGFQFYNVIDREISEASISQIQVIETDDLQTITVDNVSDLTTYTQRVSTYEQTSKDLVKASSNYIENLSFDYTHIFYFEDDLLLHKEFSEDAIQLNGINKEILIVLTEETPIETNVDTESITFYDLNGQYLIHVKPIQTGKYQLGFKDVVVYFENLER